MKKLLLLSLAFTLTACSHVGNDLWRDQQSLVMPQLIPAENKELMESLVVSSITDDIDLAFVLDADTKYKFIEKYQLTDWEIDLETLAKKARDNLNKLAAKTDIHVATASESPTDRYAVIEVGDGYAAARMLSDNTYTALKRELGTAEFVVAIPTRDFFIAWHPELTVSNEFVKQVRAEYEAAGKYKLSPNVFLRDKDGIKAVLQQ